MAANKPTPSQTVGPFFHHALKWAKSEDRAPTANEIRIRGTIYDGDQKPISDAMIEGTSASGGAFFRAYANEQGEFALVLPRAAADAALAYVTVFARGLLNHHFTFVVDREDHPLLAKIPVARRATLVASSTSKNEYAWSIYMQGERETVFVDYE